MATENVQADLDKLKQDLHQLRHDLGSIRDDAIGVGRQRARAVRDRAEEKWEDSVQGVRDYIEERPLTTMAVAFGVGFLAAKLFGSK